MVINALMHSFNLFVARCNKPTYPNNALALNFVLALLTEKVSGCDNGPPSAQIEVSHTSNASLNAEAIWPALAMYQFFPG